MTSNKTPLVYTFLIFCLFLPNIIKAEEQTPYALLENITKNLFSQISNLSDEERKHKGVIQNLVEQELMPHIDHKYVSYKILGKHLKHASKEQRESFTRAMYKYLLKTYTSALSRYKKQTVIYAPERSSTSKRFVSTSAKIVAVGAPTIDLNFKLRRSKNSKQWQIFDMEVEGVSLLSSKQAEIKSIIRKVGLDETIIKMLARSKT